MQFDEARVEKMLRSMFFMAALHGAYLVARKQWNWENRMKYENSCVKFLMNKEKGKTK